jgi:hypothetical protein
LNLLPPYNRWAIRHEKNRKAEEEKFSNYAQIEVASVMAIAGKSAALDTLTP